jgi:Spy/CpxP family protein refolding chaperone
MRRTVLILISAFLLTLAAGGVVGRIAMSPIKAPVVGPDGGWLAQQLQLTDNQRSRVQSIWDHTHSEMDQNIQQRRAIDEEFQQNLLNLFDADQKARYFALRDKANAAAEGINSEMRADVDRSIEQTKAVLTPQQVEKYNQLLTRFPAKGPPDAGVVHLSTVPGFMEPPPPPPPPSGQ